MSACLHPINLKNLTRSHKFKYRFLSKISIHCDIDRNKLSDIIQFSFSQKGDLSVFGYNTISQEFWAKKIIKDDFLLHFTLTINSIGYESSNIIITPILGSDKEIKNLVHNVKEMINLYEDSNFIKHCIDKNLIY
jgi:hypothetical protein